MVLRDEKFVKKMCLVLRPSRCIINAFIDLGALSIIDYSHDAYFWRPRRHGSPR